MAIDTIAAIATPVGIGGVGIIRISGPEAVAVASRLAGSRVLGLPSHRLTRVDLRSPGSGGLLDQALLVAMHGPHSYTGETVVELHCHGGVVHLDGVLRAVLSAGARLAQPGEFTRRAFLNGRLDLVQVEAVLDLLEARSDAACRLAMRNLEGRLSELVIDLRERLAQALALVETAIDFSADEALYALDRPALQLTLTRLLQELGELLASYDSGRKLKEGIRCVIAGQPNSGKSTLFNRLLQLDRAITSPVPGTTRDYLDAELVLGGQLLWLVDTAGLSTAEDAIEAEGVRRARGCLDEADLVLLVIDASRGFSPQDQALLGQLATPGILVQNKIDLGLTGTLPPLPEHWLGPVPVQLDRPQSLKPMQDALIDALRRFGLAPSPEAAAISRGRHREALQRSEAALNQALSSILAHEGEEVVALDMRLALDALGEIVGSVTEADILDRIFAQFCVGK